MNPHTVVKLLSHRQRERLIAHVASFQLIDNQTSPEKCTKRQVTTSLIGLGLIRRTLTDDNNGHYGVPIKPTMTILTDLGREVAAGVLAEYAEQLVEAGCLDPGMMREMKSPKLSDDRVISWNRMRTLTRIGD